MTERPIGLTFPPRVGDSLDRRYELVEMVSSGRTANVFRARDHELERVVTIKVLHPRLAAKTREVEQFLREGRLAAALAHTNIVTVLAEGDVAGAPYTVFEHVAGMTLRQLLQRAHRLPVARALEIGIGISDGLAHAHAHGYVHGDLKLEDVLLTTQGTPKLTGFGVDRSLVSSEKTSEGRAVIGGAESMVAEQSQTPDLGPQGDVYSLGVVLYELLTGELPHPGHDRVSVAIGRFSGTPHALSNKPERVPGRLDRTISKALAQEPGNRFATMLVFGHELRSCRDELSETTRPVRSSGTPGVRRPRRKPVIPAAGASPSTGRRSTLSRRVLVPVLILAALAAAVLGLTEPWNSGQKPAAVPKPAVRRIVHVKHRVVPPPPLPRLSAVATYDPPPGDGAEHDEALRFATDGDTGTAWSTEWYHVQNLGDIKPGVGILLDARRAVRLQALSIQSDTPGFTAVVKTGSTTHGPFRPVSAQHLIGRRTTIALHVSQPGRYYLIWITGLDAETAPNYHADINEARASRRPGA